MQHSHNQLAASHQRPDTASWPEPESVSLAYRESTAANEAADDMANFARLGKDQPLAVAAGHAEDGRQVWKIYALGTPVSLSHGIDVLRRLGLSVADYAIHHFAFAGVGPASLQCFVTDRQGAANPVLAPMLQGALDGSIECDEFSPLAVAGGLAPREIMLLRACARYWRQIGCVFGQDDIAGALIRRIEVTRALVGRFHARLALPPCSPENEAASLEQLSALLGALTADDERRILSGIGGLIEAVLRTNFYQTDNAGRDKDYLALKFDCAAVDGLPAPKPLVEIFVYSARMEGIHLRGGKVARGGLRWSDRAHDFRTEVHGLFKAQMVKNVVIVPEGAKGGFVVKCPPAEGGEALRREGIACYSTLIRGLLDLTDNLVGGAVVPPADVRRRDGDDAYLVVAADKGTATFSDIANAISREYGFWLGDAFASGGSVGYDHKALGITARGAWEAVKRHFRELGIDAQRAPIDVVGVGDMSGDVFGNGLLLGPEMRLIGAFDHRHIFVDPQPLAGRGFGERQRLFALPASSWADFDPAALGPGGAIYPRSATSIALSAEAQARFELPAEVSPQQLMSGILKARVDLLWLGGIGTYVRAADESDAAASDRHNDAIRIEGRQIRARVVGEGANLGLTQRGRVEAALNGVALNTDAIDNAGGVSCSDHEVNIKILLDAAMAAGRISGEARDALLASMADEVCDLVLDDIKLQTQALSVAERRAADNLDRHRRLIGFFEQTGQLERSIAGLPNDETLAARRASASGLTRPELSVLLAHTKIALFGEFIKSDLPDDPLLERDLLDYFPSKLRVDYRAEILAHPLRREIITMAVVNSMVNRIGSGFVNDIHERTGASDAEIARAYLVSRELFDLEACWAEIEALDTPTGSAAHLALMLASREIIEQATVWLLRNKPSPINISATVAEIKPLLAGYRQAGPEMGGTSPAFPTLLPGSGTPPALAERMARQRQLVQALDLIALATTGEQGDAIERALGAINSALDIPGLKEMLSDIPTRSPREANALTCLLDLAEAMPIRLLRQTLSNPAATAEQWLARLTSANQAGLNLYRTRYKQLAGSPSPDLADAITLGLALRDLATKY